MQDSNKNLKASAFNNYSNLKTISIIIVSFNSLSYLKNCLDSIVKFPPGLGENEYEVIIVDNNSTDGTADFIEKNYLKYSFIKL